MTVIINELEVIAPPPQERLAQERRAENTPPPGPTPEDIYRVVRQQLLRQLRIQTD